MEIALRVTGLAVADVGRMSTVVLIAAVTSLVLMLILGATWGRWRRRNATLRAYDKRLSLGWKMYLGDTLPFPQLAARCWNRGHDRQIVSAEVRQGYETAVLLALQWKEGQGRDEKTFTELVVAAPFEGNLPVVEVAVEDRWHVRSYFEKDVDTESTLFNRRFQTTGTVEDITAVLVPRLQQAFLDSFPVAAVSFQGGWVVAEVGPDSSDKQLGEVLTWLLAVRDSVASSAARGGDPLPGAAGWQELLSTSPDAMEASTQATLKDLRSAAGRPPWLEEHTPAWLFPALMAVLTLLALGGLALARLLPLLVPALTDPSRLSSFRPILFLAGIFVVVWAVSSLWRTFKHGRLLGGRRPKTAVVALLVGAALVWVGLPNKAESAQEWAADKSQVDRVLAQLDARLLGKDVTVTSEDTTTNHGYDSQGSELTVTTTHLNADSSFSTTWVDTDTGTGAQLRNDTLSCSSNDVCKYEKASDSSTYQPAGSTSLRPIQAQEEWARALSNAGLSFGLADTSAAGSSRGQLSLGSLLEEYYGKSAWYTAEGNDVVVRKSQFGRELLRITPTDAGLNVNDGRRTYTWKIS